MRKLRSDTELMLSLFYFRSDPKPYAERLKAAAENYLTDPAIAEGLRRARPYTERLALAAIKCAEAVPADLPLALSALAEIVAAATKEQKDERDASLRRELEAEKARAIATGDLPPDAELQAIRTRWDERADLQ